MSDDSTKIDPTLPEVVQNFLKSGAKLEEIRLDARGQWTHEGLLFENPRLIKLFSRSVSRTSGGTWVLEIGHFTYPIVVEDTGFFVEHIAWENKPPTLTLSDETSEELDFDSLHYEPEGRLYCSVKEGRFKARFKRQAYHSIMEHLVEEEGQIVLVIGDRKKVLGQM